MEPSEWLEFVNEPLLRVPSSDPQMAPSPPPEKPVAAKTLAQRPIIAPPTPPIPTPPESHAGSPIDEADEPTILSVSTTFYPGAGLAPSLPDIVLLSSDTVFFYVHSPVLLRESSNRLNALLPPPEELASQPPDGVGPVVPLPEPSTTLNLVLHTMYGLSCLHYSPSSATLNAGVDALAKYGVDLKQHIRPGTPLFEHLLGQSPAAPLDFYATAGHHNLWELAAAISPHLLHFPLSDLDDDIDNRMGAFYLKKLFFLHLGRVDALKRLLLPAPQGHPATPECDFLEQKKLTRAWALAAAYLTWDARPDLSPTAIELALRPLGDHLSCEICQTSLHERVKQLTVQWSLVKRTI
ncbi:hypothetical protein PHLGIDRAFT_127472 [Phlebiopsis gigantea 11061_1 CR5-6]|uniref:BTB domain-containing protein n=1 Tax=Phlebiopsis gigantea (strain 11061_1 CR5-6) TaxID=745531 RepID=A0A0C3RZC7_PHLG1|nr:hypothetical protein PHLGIDRAFT_127472 [Phlebiopsis gigantea 11061_1 CR5-6]